MDRLVLIFIYISLPAIYCQIDPCRTHFLLDNTQRSSAFTTTGVAISDDRIREGWYRVVSLSGQNMPTEPPGFMRCGTLNPIWLNGTLPTTVNAEMKLPVCIETLFSSCQATWNITIRKCPGGFLVYHLVPSKQSSAAYCFGTELQCPDGEYSENGFSPGCTENVPQDTISPEVTADLVFGKTIDDTLGPSLEPVFDCLFSDVTGQSYAYDVHWFINDETVIVHRRLNFSNIEQALLRPADWVKTYRLNMVVQCGVRVRFNSSSVPGPMFESPIFEAGVKPDKTVYHLKEGEEISVSFTSSVPVGCFGSTHRIRPYCTRTLKIAQPKYQSAPTETCNSNIQAESLAFTTQDCGITLTSDNWEDRVYLNVTGYIDNVYNVADRVGHIRLTTDLNSSTDVSEVWDKINIPDVQIYVSDKDSSLTTRICKVWSDPTFETADGTRFDYNGAGEFILYRHKRYPYWVHILTSACSWNRFLTCVCGVAVRSHDSLFSIRYCDVVQTGKDSVYISGRTYPDIAFSDCDNKHMTIKESPSDVYQVSLPIGTEMVFDWSYKPFPSITLKPSLLDIEQSEGICGYISKEQDKTDDLKPRGSNTTTSSQVNFVRSWGVVHGSDEELFSPSPQFPIEDPFLKEYCLCASEADQNDNIADFVDIQCNLTAPMIQCKNTRTNHAQSLYEVCHRERQTRDVVDSDDVFDDTPLTYDPNFDPNFLPPMPKIVNIQPYITGYNVTFRVSVVVVFGGLHRSGENAGWEPVWKNGWDETQAKQACIEAIGNIPALQSCKTFAGIQEENYIQSCIDDVKTAGTSDVIINTVKMIQLTCQMEIKRNESLWKTQNGGESILVQIENLLCSQNCAKNGYCNRTQCVCNPGYKGPDCSIPLSDPPNAITVPDKGMCNTRSRACAKTNIFGKFYSKTVYCHLIHYTIQPTGKEYSGMVYTTTAEYSSETKVSCTFPERKRNQRGTTPMPEGYDTSLSYDQVNYGQSVSILIYDGQCYTCNVTTVVCSRLDSCQDSPGEDNEVVRKENNGTSSTVLGAAIAISILVVVIASILILYKCKLDKNKKQCKISNKLDMLNDKECEGSCAPPTSTALTPNQRGNSYLPFEWSIKPQSVHDVFTVEQLKQKIKQ